MSKLTSLIRRAPKRFSAVVAMLAAAIIVPAVVFAWGPNRATFTVQNPAPYVTFNSITDNPNYGDERNFVTIKDAANTSAGGWTDDINVQPGKEYYVRMYVHNNAAENLNLVAQNVTAKFNVPDHSAKRIQIDGYLSSSNANPAQVWDQAVFSSSSNFSLDYQEGSARFTNNVFTGGTALSDGVVGNGATLGYDKLDGKIPGCFKYDGFVTFKVKAQVSDFDVQKTVRVNGATDKTFKESVAVKPGDKVDYQIYFKNTGNTQLKDVVIKDILPAGVSYVPGTTYLYNSGGNRVIADGITAGGAIIGGYLPGGDAYMKFTAQVAANDKLPVCGPNTLRNVARATTDTGTKEDGANVTVTKECQPEVKYACKALGITQVNRTTYRFSTSYMAENATFKSVTYVIKNAAGQTVDTKTSTSTTLDYTQATTGRYTVQATVTFTVNGQDKTATSEACKGAFEVKEEDKHIKVCELATKKIITINEKDFDASKHSKNLADCKEAPKTLEVCDLTTKDIVTINESAFDASKHTTDFSKCEETPVTPPELPKTGAGDGIVALVGLSALIASAAYYIASRRALNQ